MCDRGNDLCLNEICELLSGDVAGFKAYDHNPSYTRRVYDGFGGIFGYMMGWVYDGSERQSD